jgi:hypothetical protein
VPHLIFNAKTLKLCSKIKFATQAQQTAPSRYKWRASSKVLKDSSALLTTRIYCILMWTLTRLILCKSLCHHGQSHR